MDKLRKAFEAFDQDGSGAVTAEELMAILERPGGGAPLAKESAQAIVNAFDKNADGKLQYEEFTHHDGNPCRVSKDSLQR